MSENLQLTCVQPPTSSYNLLLACVKPPTSRTGQTGQTGQTFKLDFPGNLWLAAFAILAMFTFFVGETIYLQLVIVTFRLLELTERNQLEEGSPLLFFKISFFVLEALSGLGTIYLLTKPGNQRTLWATCQIIQRKEGNKNARRCHRRDGSDWTKRPHCSLIHFR